MPYSCANELVTTSHSTIWQPEFSNPLQNSAGFFLVVDGINIHIIAQYLAQKRGVAGDGRKPMTAYLQL